MSDQSFASPYGRRSATDAPPDARCGRRAAQPSHEQTPASQDIVCGSAIVRPKQRFSVGFSDIGSSVERFDGGQLWVYVGIRKRTIADFAVRTRRNGRVTIVASRKRQTPPITLAPEDPPVWRNGFRGWLPISLPPLTRAEADRLSLALRVSPASPTDLLSRVYAAFAELDPAS